VVREVLDELGPESFEQVIRRLEVDVFPWLGSRRARDVSPPELLACLRRVEALGALDTAHRVLQNCGQIFRYAVATGRADRDPAADLHGALPPPNSGHFAGITEPAKIGALLRSIEGYEGTHVARCALRLAPLVLVRPGELRKAEWAEFDLDGAEWRIPGERQLAHGERDEVRAAYNYAEYLAERRTMMQAWDYAGLRAGANVIPIKRAG
jgi:integrase